MTVTLASRDGVFEAVSDDGVIVSGQDSARTFTGSLADLNRFFTNADKILYTHVALEDQRSLTVTVMQNGLLHQASASNTVASGSIE